MRTGDSQAGQSTNDPAGRSPVRSHRSPQLSQTSRAMVTGPRATVEYILAKLMAEPPPVPRPGDSRACVSNLGPMTDPITSVESDGPHGGQPIETAGSPIEDADVAAVLCHGRGATARGMLGLADELRREGVAYAAPQATRGTWYPNSFMAPVESNQPHLDSALDAVGNAVDVVASGGAPPDRTVLLGFSQGACLACEFAVRNSRQYGGLVAFSGGVIGPEGTTWDTDGSLEGTPAFLGCSDRDPHIPEERVHETADVLEALDADVEERIYEGMGHTVNEDELDWVRGLLDDLLAD